MLNPFHVHAWPISQHQTNVERATLGLDLTLKFAPKAPSACTLEMQQVGRTICVREGESLWKVICAEWFRTTPKKRSVFGIRRWDRREDLNSHPPKTWVQRKSGRTERFSGDRASESTGPNRTENGAFTNHHHPLRPRLDELLIGWNSCVRQGSNLGSHLPNFTNLQDREPTSKSLVEEQDRTCELL